MFRKVYLKRTTSVHHLLAVGMGGFFGAIARYSLSGFMQRSFPGFRPAGTLLVNALGCLAIGIVMALLIDKKFSMDNEAVRALLVTGFLGSLTTFSAFGYETVEFIRESEPRLAFLNVAANMLIGFAAVWAGWWLVKAG